MTYLIFLQLNVKSIYGECKDISLQNCIMVTTIAITESWILGKKLDKIIIIIIVIIIIIYMHIYIMIIIIYNNTLYIDNR